jgi:hypothetical protein
MSWPVRIVAFGSALGLIVFGIVCAAVIRGSTGQILGIGGIGIGGILLTSLAFLEVGLSEDREREREAQTRPKEPARAERTKRARFDQSRGHRRRLG